MKAMLLRPRRLITALLALLLASAMLAGSSQLGEATRQYHTNMLRINSGWNMQSVIVCGTTTAGYECTPKYRVNGNAKDVTWWFKIGRDFPVKVSFDLVGYGERSCVVPLSLNYNEYLQQSYSPWATVIYKGNGRCAVLFDYWR